jgi:hypothetical protein
MVDLVLPVNGRGLDRWRCGKNSGVEEVIDRCVCQQTIWLNWSIEQLEKRNATNAYRTP